MGQVLCKTQKSGDVKIGRNVQKLKQTGHYSAKAGIGLIRSAIWPDVTQEDGALCQGRRDTPSKPERSA